MSAHHAVAVAALRGRAGLAEFSDAAAVEPELRAFRRRVRVVPDGVGGEGLSPVLNQPDER